MTHLSVPVLIGLVVVLSLLGFASRIVLHFELLYDKWPWDAIGSPEWDRKNQWSFRLPSSAAPPAVLHSLEEARSAACAALGLGSEWSAEPATPLGVLLRETPVTIPQLRARLRSLYRRDIGDVDEATPIGAVASAIYLPGRTGDS